MTPAEEAFVFELIERVADMAYARGFDDASQKKARHEAFKLTPANKLELKTRVAMTNRR